MRGGGREILAEYYAPDRDDPAGESHLCAAGCGSESRRLSDIRWCARCAVALWAIRGGAPVAERIKFLRERGIQ